MEVKVLAVKTTEEEESERERLIEMNIPPPEDYLNYEVVSHYFCLGDTESLFGVFEDERFTNGKVMKIIMTTGEVVSCEYNKEVYNEIIEYITYKDNEVRDKIKGQKTFYNDNTTTT